MSSTTPADEAPTSGAPLAVKRLPRGRRALLVASTGGHLAQLDLVSKMLDCPPSSHWVTFPNAQSESLMAGRNHTLVPYIGPRQGWRAAKTLTTFAALLRRHRSEAVISTGAAVAAPALLLAVAMGIPAYYLESVSRVKGPSMTGRLMRWMPGVTTFTQHRAWSGSGWHHDITVFDAFVLERDGRRRDAAEAGDRPLRVFVSLGTIRPYRFDALVDAVHAATAGADVDLVWQLGCTDRDDLRGEVLGELPTSRFEEEVDRADLVITHAGVATCLRLVEKGVRAVVVNRRASRGEHVDDHQSQISEELARRDLCTHLEVPEVTAQALADHLGLSALPAARASAA